MTKPDVRKEMPPVKLSREEFESRYRSQFVDPAFALLKRELHAIVGLTDMHLISAGRFGETDGYVGYMNNAISHRERDEDGAFQRR